MAGNNAFFVRKDVSGAVRAQTAVGGYVESHFREARNPDGKLSFLSGPERLKLIADLPVLCVETGRQDALKAFVPGGATEI